MWTCFITYITKFYVNSFSANKGPLSGLDEWHQYWNRNDSSYFLICLLGKVEGENVKRSHLIPCHNTTATGINLKANFQRLVNLKTDQGFIQSTVISSCNEYPIPTSEFDNLVAEVLGDDITEEPSLF